MKKFVLGLLVLGLTSQLFSQVVSLPEIEIASVNYKYLDAIDSEDLDINVKMLQEKVAQFDVRNTDLYVDDYYTYQVTFFIPNGKILVAYDKNGEMVRTVERFKNVKIPIIVKKSISERYPGWFFKKDVYRVTYNQEGSKKEYKITLEKGKDIINVKTDENGNFLDEMVF